MATNHYRSEDAQDNLRDIVNDVMMGRAESVIEQHGKPAAVVVSDAQWQAWKRERTAKIMRIRAKMDAGGFVTQEELEAGLQAQGLL